MDSPWSYMNRGICMAEVRKQIVFQGRVQSVGFRYKAKYYASNYGLKGWVRNEYDGTVLMEVQGQEQFINQLLVHLNQDRYIEIEWMHAKEIELEDGKGFHIR